MNNSARKPLTHTYAVGDLGHSSLKTEDDRIYTTDEAAEFLRISPAQLRNLCSQGKVPYFKLGASNRFSRSDLIVLLQRNKRGGF